MCSRQQLVPHRCALAEAACGGCAEGGGWLQPHSHRSESQYIKMDDAAAGVTSSRTHRLAEGRRALPKD